jgi:hypothetical protein
MKSFRSPRRCRERWRSCDCRTSATAGAESRYEEVYQLRGEPRSSTSTFRWPPSGVGDLMGRSCRHRPAPVPSHGPAPVEDPLPAVQADAPGGDDADFTLLELRGQGFSA